MTVRLSGPMTGGVSNSHNIKREVKKMKVPKFLTVVREIPIDMIQIDPTVQARFQQSGETIFRYSESLAKGDKFPPSEKSVLKVFLCME
jgi:hypothetical protein